MFDWFLNNKPEYWKAYVKTFTTSSSNTLENSRFVVFDTETTGLNTKTDRILSIGAVSIQGNQIKLSDSFEQFLIQEKFEPGTVEIHGILKDGIQQKATELEAIKSFLEYIQSSIIIAHHAAFDIEMINQCLKRTGLPKLKNRVLDTGILYKKLNEAENKHYSLDQLCEIFNVKVHDRHNAMGDAYITAQIFLKLMAKMKKERPVTLEDLFVNRNRPGLI